MRILAQLSSPPGVCSASSDQLDKYKCTTPIWRHLINSGATPPEVKQFVVATGPCSMFGVGLRNTAFVEKCAVENALLKNALLKNAFLKESFVQK